MSDFPGATVATPPVVNTYSLNAAAGSMALSTGNPSAITWVANLAIYVPVLIPWPYTVNRVWWGNGSTVTTTNVDFGIYGGDGSRIYSTGSTAQSGTSTIQMVTPTTFQLSAGAYYFAWSCNNTTNRGQGQGIAINTLRLGGVLQEASAFPLPSVMTGVAVSNALYPLCGVSRVTTVL